MSYNSVANAEGDSLLYGGPVDPRVTAIQMPPNAVYIYAPNSGNGALLRKQAGGGPTDFDTLVTDAMERDFSNALPSANDIDMGGFTVINAADPVNAQDLATKNYVDTEIASIPGGMATDFSNAVASANDIDLGNFSINNVASLVPSSNFDILALAGNLSLSVNAGNIGLFTNAGTISFLDASQPNPNPGDVWTSLGIDGSGYWSPAVTGMNTDFSNAAAAANNLNINSNSLLSVASINNSVANLDFQIITDNATLTVQNGGLISLDNQGNDNIEFIGDVIDFSQSSEVSLGGIPINDVGNLIPDVTGSRNLGAANFDFGNLFVNNIYNTGNNAIALSMSTANAVRASVNINPFSSGGADLGTIVDYWNNVRSANMTVGFGGTNRWLALQSNTTENFRIGGGNTSPNPVGVVATGAIRGVTFGSSFNIDSLSGNSASASGALYMATGNNAGAGNSGNIVLYTGSVTTGIRGKITLDALMATLPIGTADPATGSEQNGDAYYKTDTNELRVYNGGVWRGVALA